MKRFGLAASIALWTFVGGSAAIAQSSSQAVVAPSPEALQRCATAQGRSAPPKMATALPLDNFYPTVSKRGGEQGRVVVSVSVDTNGRTIPGSAVVKTSSGYPKLDEGAMRWALVSRYLPGCEKGKPIAKTASIGVTFKLDDGFAPAAAESAQSRSRELSHKASSTSQQCNRPGATMAHNPQVPGEQWGSWVFFMLNKEATRVEGYTAALKIAGRSVMSYQSACQVSAYKVGQAACGAMGANCVSIGGCTANADMVVVSPIDDSWLFVGCGRTYADSKAMAIAECERKSGCKCQEHRDGVSGMTVSKIAGSYHAQSCASIATQNAASIAQRFTVRDFMGKLLDVTPR